MSDIKFCSTHGFFETEDCPTCRDCGLFILSAERRKEISSFLSGLLRHFPDEYGLHLSKEGWADYTAVLSILENKYNASEVHCLAIVQLDNKDRYEVRDNNIRAMYGHSVNGVSVDSTNKNRQIPAVLYHGSAPRNKDSIYNQGVLPQSRNEVHLSDTVEDAVTVGKRHSHSTEAIVFTIDAKQLLEDGYEITTPNGNVYTVGEVPPKYITSSETYS